MKRIRRNIRIYQFSLLGAMLEVNILRNVLDYRLQFHRKKVYIPRVDCVKDETKFKAMFYNSKGFRLHFWDPFITQMF